MANLCVCDRCNSTIESTYYELNVRAYPVPGDIGLVSAAYNIANSFCKNKILCKSCLNKLSDFIEADKLILDSVSEDLISKIEVLEASEAELQAISGYSIKQLIELFRNGCSVKPMES